MSDSGDERERFRRDVAAGFSATPKWLPAKWFYDEEGSRLFDEITRLPEYYPTRADTALLRALAPDLAARIPQGAVLVEFGSGSSEKTRILLDAAPQLAAYVPIDISAEHLAAAAEGLRDAYPRLTVAPLAADFTRAVKLPPEAGEGPRVGFFPGSTLGNFDPNDARRFLASAGALLGPGSLFLVGVDLAKDEQTLVAAYDDGAGVTAAFNKNVLERMNRELEGSIDPDAFEHRAVWNAADSRIEMHLVSRSDQRFRVDGVEVAMKAGETLHTESSYKFTPEGFERLAAAAGWRLTRSWISPPPVFAEFLLER